MPTHGDWKKIVTAIYWFRNDQVVRLRKAGLTVNTHWQSSLLAPHDLPFAIEQLPFVFTDNLKLDWRAGAAWFEAQLIDYDVYSNQGNWLYIAGLGTDPRGGRAMRTDKQAAEHDRDETYRKQWGTL